MLPGFFRYIIVGIGILLQYIAALYKNIKS